MWRSKQSLAVSLHIVLVTLPLAAFLVDHKRPQPLSFLSPGTSAHRRFVSEKDEDDEFDIDVDTSKFTPPKMLSLGPGRGRSAPSHRKAVGKGGSSSTSVHVCTNCASEFVKWVGR